MTGSDSIPPSDLHVRPAGPGEFDPLVRLWRDGWHEAHASIVPEELTRRRTYADFTDRLRKLMPNVRVVGPDGAPLGFHVVLGNELNQLYVAPVARGTGAAAALIRDAETVLRASGVGLAWLACSIGNDRAARFYKRCGWHRSGVVTIACATAQGDFPLEVWRYEKRIGPD